MGDAIPEVTSEERELAFREDLQKFLDKHGAEVELYFHSYNECDFTVTQVAIWDKGKLIKDYAEFVMDL